METAEKFTQTTLGRPNPPAQHSLVEERHQKKKPNDSLQQDPNTPKLSEKSKQTNYLNGTIETLVFTQQNASPKKPKREKSTKFTLNVFKEMSKTPAAWQKVMRKKRPPRTRLSCPDVLVVKM